MSDEPTIYDSLDRGELRTLLGERNIGRPAKLKNATMIQKLLDSDAEKMRIDPTWDPAKGLADYQGSKANLQPEAEAEDKRTHPDYPKSGYEVSASKVVKPLVKVDPPPKMVIDPNRKYEVLEPCSIPVNGFLTGLAQGAEVSLRSHPKLQLFVDECGLKLS